MRLQRQKSRIEGKRVYYKYVIVLSQTIVKKAKFRTGQEIEADAKNGRIILKKK